MGKDELGNIPDADPEGLADLLGEGLAGTAPPGHAPDTESGAHSRSAEARPPSPTVHIPDYEVIRELHRGGQGVVYEAIQRSTKRKVAIKVLVGGRQATKTARKRFEREIELVAQLRHPNIIAIFDSGATSDEMQFYVMDYVRGLPLHRYVREKKLALEDTLRLFSKVCEAVQYAHQRGVIHRDLKPSNILVDAEGDPKVLDFGLAKSLITPVETIVSISQDVIGTLPYMSPEQTRGNPDEIDTRTDIYSLGVILYELLTGGYPYPVVGQMAEVLKNIAEEEPKRPSSIDRKINDEVATIVLKALAKERTRRYQSADALARDIGHYLAGQPIEAKRDSQWYVIKKTLQRYKVPACLALGFVMTLAVALGLAAAAWRLAAAERNRAEIAEKEATAQTRIAEEARADLIAHRLELAIDMSNVRRAREYLRQLNEDYGNTSLARSQAQRWRRLEARLREVDLSREELARSRFDALKQHVDAGDYLRAHLSLETIERRFVDTDLIRGKAEQIGNLSENVEGEIAKRELTTTNEYTFDSSPASTEPWKTAVANARGLLQKPDTRASKGLVVFRVLLEDETAEDHCQLKGEGVVFWSCCWGYSPFEQVKSGDTVIAGFGHPVSEPITRQIQIGSLYHHSPTIDLVFQQGEVRQLGDIVVRSMPPDSTGNLVVTVKPEPGLLLAGGEVKVSRFFARLATSNQPILVTNRAVFPNIAPGEYEIVASSKGRFRSPSSRVVVAVGELTETELVVYRLREVTLEWWFRRMAEPEEWSTGSYSAITGEYWQPDQAWGVHYPVLAVTDWDGEGCLLRSSNATLVRLRDYEIAVPPDAIPQEAIARARRGGMYDLDLEVGAVYGLIRVADHDPWEALIRIRSVTPVMDSADEGTGPRGP